MRTVDLIHRKRDGEELSAEEIHFLIDGYTRTEIPDYQISAFLMAVYFSGMTDREVSVMTESMMNSGSIVDLSSIPGIKVDKHSTGGRRRQDQPDCLPFGSSSWRSGSDDLRACPRAYRRYAR